MSVTLKPLSNEMTLGMKVGWYGPVLHTATKFFSSTQYQKEGKGAARQNPHSKPVTVTLLARQHVC